MLRSTFLKSFLIFISCFSASVFSAEKLTYLKVEGELVYFSNGNKTHTSPACAVEPTKNLWVTSLATESGRGVYAMLVTAMAAKSAVEVTSSSSCDANGIEELSAIEIIPEVSSPSSTTQSLKLVAKGKRTFNTTNQAGTCTVVQTANDSNGQPYLYANSFSGTHLYGDCLCRNSQMHTSFGLINDESNTSLSRSNYEVSCYIIEQ